MEHASDIIHPRIYVACLAAYNNGQLHGRWIDAEQDAWAIYDEIASMLMASSVVGAEEWAIHDYGGFEGVRINEAEGIERVAEIAAFIVEHGKVGAELIVYYGGDIGEARNTMADRYHGSYLSLRDYMQEAIEEGSGAEIPEALRCYIDWEAMARDAEMSGDLFTIETGYAEVHIFSGH